MTTNLLLDTCAVIWLGQGRPLAEAAEAAINQAYADGAPITVSAITAWEIGMLSAKGRLAASIPPLQLFNRFVKAPGVRVAPLAPDVLIESSFLPGEFHADPADRIIVATARSEALTLVTADRLILTYARHGHVNALPC